MATTVFTRRRRTGPVRPPAADLTVDAPPALPRAVNGVAARLAPVIMVVAAVGTVAMVVASGSATGHTPMLLVLPVVMIASAVAAVASGSGGRQRAELDADRRRYLDYLASLSDRLTEDAVAEHDRLLDNHPEPEALWTVVGSTRMWARHRDETDFCVVRVGVGAVPATTRLSGPAAERPGEQDPVTASALGRLLRAHGRVPEGPVAVTLAAGATVTVSGDGDEARALLRAVICQLAVAHSPDDVGVVAFVGEAQGGDWDWLKWLPHRSHCPEPDGRRLVVVVDGGDPPAPDAVSTVLHIGTVAAPDTDLRVDDGAGAVILTRHDQMTPVAALAVARRLAGYRPGSDPAGGSRGWLARVGVGDPAHIDPEMLWDNQFSAPLRVPIGTSEDGGTVDLDIREAAADGMGPHGLCLGATGSGKSELLRTIALGMIARHSPETLNLVLVDFKGGATFLDLARTRHTTAVITNLEEEAGLVDRMRDALGGEIDRRQRILRAAGNLSGVAEYHRARQAGRPLAPLPALFIIVDEFSELLSRHPEFVDVFVAIGRLGRSLGMHLLLASQRLDEGRLRGLDSHLSYRICLKTLSEAESRMAIGVPDAYHLAPRPGAAYLKVAAGQPVRFQAAYVSGRLSGARSGPAGEDTVPRVFSAAAPPIRDTGPTPRCSRRWSTGWLGTVRRRIGCGCHR